mmetsp:Transcript_101470/g.287520  ORF Transcript_101470/g.287520 Transcript_101470/m.287520 type:complete len:467 (-) Transcript_101470:293-1693(-)
MVARRPELRFGDVDGQHATFKRRVASLRVLVEVQGHVGHRGDGGRERDVAEAARVDGGLVAQGEAAPVAVGEGPDVLAGLHEPVHVEIRVETDDFDDVVDVLQDLAVVQDDAAGLQPLHLRVDHLRQAEVNGEEENVADAPASVLLDAGHGAVRVRRHGEKSPRVPAAHGVHRLHRVQDHGSRGRAGALVDPPAEDAGQHEVEVARDVPDLPPPVLDDRPHVLVREGAHAYDDGVLVLDLCVFELARETVAYVPAEDVLPGPGLPVRDDQAAGEDAHAGAREVALAGVPGLRGLVVEVVALLPYVGPLVRLGHDHHVRDLRGQLGGRGDPVVVARVREVLQDLLRRGPVRVGLGEHEAPDVLVVHVVLQLVVGALRLQLGGGVRDPDPGVAAHLRLPLEDAEGHLLPRVVDGLPEPHVPGADDHVRVGPLEDAHGEALDALHEDVGGDLVAVPVSLVAGPELEHEL